jgi:hypothetical protein
MRKKLCLSTLARIAERTPISFGCFCADESRCHRSRLFRIVEHRAASHSK